MEKDQQDAMWPGYVKFGDGQGVPVEAAIAEQIVAAVMANLDDRKGVFDDIDDDIMQEIRDDLIATVAALAAPAQVEAAPQAEPSPWKHAANEWADAAYNGLQWLRNIEDGISDAKKARENMEQSCKHAKAVSDAARLAQPAQACNTQVASADYVLVPRKMTSDMSVALSSGTMGPGWMDYAQKKWSAMIAAAPTGAEGAQDDLLSRLYARHKDWAARSGHAPMAWEEFQADRMSHPLTASAVEREQSPEAAKYGVARTISEAPAHRIEELEASVNEWRNRALVAEQKLCAVAGAEGAQQQTDTGKLREALESIKAMTDADNPESYRCDDREGCLDTVFATARDTLAAPTESAAAPIPMILHCPKCLVQHIDAPDERTPGWKNEPHRSHLCHACGHIWRPADVPTEGVRAIQTKGSNDSESAAAEAAADREKAFTEGWNDALRSARADIREMQNHLETFGPSEEAARIALDGALNAIDDLATHQPSTQPGEEA